MIIWIFVELAITGYMWLQALYFALGVSVSRLVSPPAIPADT